jgi:hypothetical protein
MTYKVFESSRLAELKADKPGPGPRPSLRAAAAPATAAAAAPAALRSSAGLPPEARARQGLRPRSTGTWRRAGLALSP